jgi:hypothetical protein
VLVFRAAYWLLRRHEITVAAMAVNHFLTGERVSLCKDGSLWRVLEVNPSDLTLRLRRYA